MRLILRSQYSFALIFCDEFDRSVTIFDFYNEYYS